MMTNTEFTAAHNRLGNRSSKILGGYVTEHMLLNAFMSSDMVCTKSWWFSSANRKPFWFVEKTALSRLDHKICALLTENGHKCFQLYLEDGRWKIRQIETGPVWTVDEFVEAFSLQKIGKSHKKCDPSAHERKMLEKCIAFYRQTGMLEDIQRSIQIEDLFLNQYFYTSNIDLFFAKDVAGELEPICLEIKFKDAFFLEEKGKNVMGVEEFQLRNIFSQIEECGMKVYVAILYDSCRDRSHVESTNIFRYLESEIPQEWLYARVSHMANYWEYTMQSTRTAFTGTERKPRPVYCIPRENFDTLTDLRALIDSGKLLNSDGTAVRFCTRCGAPLRLRTGKYGSFWGCSNYPKCNYTRNY